MRDKDSLNLFESYKQVTESGNFEGGVRLHKPTGEWERLVDYLIQKGHDEDEAKVLANGFLKNRRHVKPADQVQAEEGSEFSVNPGDANYDSVDSLLESLPEGTSSIVFNLVNKIIDDRAQNAEEAIDHLLGLLEDKMEAEEEDEVGGFGGPDDSLGDVTEDPWDGDPMGSPPNDGRFPKGG